MWAQSWAHTWIQTLASSLGKANKRTFTWPRLLYESRPWILCSNVFIFIQSHVLRWSAHSVPMSKLDPQTCKMSMQCSIRTKVEHAKEYLDNKNIPRICHINPHSMCFKRINFNSNEHVLRAPLKFRPPLGRTHKWVPTSTPKPRKVEALRSRLVGPPCLYVS